MAHSHNGTTQLACPACNYGPFTRNNYFTGKLLVERDFTDETRFHMEKLRHHEQLLHGSGVVCGLKVKPHPNEACRDRFVCVEPGSAVDCCGHDIIVAEEECVDITRFAGNQSAAEQQRQGRRTRCRSACAFANVRPKTFRCSTTIAAATIPSARPIAFCESYEIGVMIDPPDQPDVLPHAEIQLGELDRRGPRGCGRAARCVASTCMF